jgi:hypothetical protein
MRKYQKRLSFWRFSHFLLFVQDLNQNSDALDSQKFMMSHRTLFSARSLNNGTRKKGTDQPHVSATKDEGLARSYPCARCSRFENSSAKKKAMYPCDGTQNKTCIVERHGHRELRFRLHGGTATHVAVGASFSKPTQPEYVNL